MKLTFTKKMFCFLFSMTFLTNVLAQSLAFAPELGVNISNVNTNETVGTTNKTGLKTGVNVSVMIDKRFYIEPGFFSHKKELKEP